MSEEVTSQLLRIAVAHTLRPLGWHSVGTSACDVLADVMGRYMLTVAKTTAAYSCHANRTDPNLTDLHQAFRDLGISIPDLTEFCSGVDLGKFKRAVPKFPCPKPSSHIYQPGGGPGSDASGTNSEEMVSMSRSLMSEEEGCISSYLPPLPSVKVAKEQGTENDVNELSDKEEVMEMGGEPSRVTVVDPDKGLPQLFRTQRLSSDFSEEGDYQSSRNSISYVAAAPATTPVDSTSIRTPVTSPEMGVKGRMPEIVAGGTRVEEQLQRGEVAEVVPAVAIEKEGSREGITSSIALKQLQGLKTKPYEKVHILQPPRSPPSATRRPKLPPLRLISPSLVEPTTPIAIAPMQQPPLSPIQRSPGPSWPGRPPGLPILSPIQRSLYRPSVPGTMEVCRRVRPVMQPMLTSPPILSPPNTDLPVVIEHVALPMGSAPIPSPAVHQSVSQSISSTPVPPLYRGALYSQPNPPQPTVAPPTAPALYGQPNPPQPTVAPPAAPALYGQPNPPQPTVAPPAAPALYGQPNPPQPTVAPPAAPALYSQPNPPQPTVAPPAAPALYSQPNPPQPTVAPPAAHALYSQPNPPQPTVAPPTAPLIVRPEEVVSKTPKQESSALYQSTNEGEERVQSPVVDRDREFYQTSPGEHPQETEREGEKSDGEEEEEEEVGEQSPILSAISSSSDEEVDDEEPPGSLLDQETPPSSPVKPISPPARVEDGSFPLPPAASAHVVGVEALRDEERKRGRARRADVQDAESIVLPVPLDLDKRPLMLSSKSPLTSPSSMSEDVEQAMVDEPASLRKQRSPVELSSLPGVDDIPVTLESSNELEESDEDSSDWEDIDTEVARDQGTAKAAFVDVAGETKEMEEEEDSPQLIVTFHRYLIKSLQTKGGGKESLRVLPKPKENLSAAVPSPLPVKLKVEPIFRPTVTLPHLEYPPPPASFVVSVDRNLLSYTKFSLPPLTLPYLRSSPSKERIKTPMASGADSIKRRLASFGVENRFRTSRSPVTMATLLPVLGAAEVPSRKRRLEAEEVEEYGAKKVKVIPQSSSSSSSSSNEDSGSLSCTPSPSPSPSPLPPPTTSQPQPVESEDEEEEEGRVGKLKLKLKISKALLKPPVAVKTPTSSARREQSLRRQKKPSKQPPKPIVSKLQMRVPKLHTAGTGKVMGTKNKGDRTQGARHSVTPTKQATSHKLSSRKTGSLSVMIKTPMPSAAKHPQLDVCPECSKPDDGTPMIACDFCDKWLHMHCVGIFQAPPETEKWFCPSCTSLKKRAATKSSRRKR